MAVWEEPEVNGQGPRGSSSGRLRHMISVGEDLDRVGQPRHLRANATRRSCSMARTPRLGGRARGSHPRRSGPRPSGTPSPSGPRPRAPHRCPRAARGLPAHPGAGGRGARVAQPAIRDLLLLCRRSTSRCSSCRPQRRGAHARARRVRELVRAAAGGVGRPGVRAHPACRASPGGPPGSSGSSAGVVVSMLRRQRAAALGVGCDGPR
jgi:hypothetical protein